MLKISGFLFLYRVVIKKYRKQSKSFSEQIKVCLAVNGLTLIFGLPGCCNMKGKERCRKES